ncbi:MAG: hypothetical protein M3Z84_02255 [Actinomycetota bacterium]|nr:hypothetical protein [Actinomycetota bacterium]
MTDGALDYIGPEAQARVEIDKKLVAAGWVVQRWGGHWSLADRTRVSRVIPLRHE